MSYTVNKDIVHIIKENGKPVAFIYNDQTTRQNVIYELKKPMSGESLGEFLSKALPLPSEFEKES